MEVRSFLNSSAALRLGHWLGRTMPVPVGLALADGVARMLARRRDSPMMQTLQANLRVVLGPEASEERVYQTARGALRHAARTNFDLYHALGVGKEAFLDLVRPSTMSVYHLDRIAQETRGVMLVVPHMSNFDLTGMSFAQRGLKLNVLSFAAPTTGYSLQNQIRQEWGINLMPIDVSALRRSMEALAAGEMVITGMDRPDPFGGGEVMPFFGRPARLPVGHVRLALQMGSPVVIAHCEYRQPDNVYMLHISQWLEMEHVGKRQENILHNAQRVLAATESLIAARPEQWLMFYRVWEDPYK